MSSYGRSRPLRNGLRPNWKPTQGGSVSRGTRKASDRRLKCNQTLGTSTVRHFTLLWGRSRTFGRKYKVLTACWSSVVRMCRRRRWTNWRRDSERLCATFGASSTCYVGRGMDLARRTGESVGGWGKLGRNGHRERQSRAASSAQGYLPRQADPARLAIVLGLQVPGVQARDRAEQEPSPQAHTGRAQASSSLGCGSRPAVRMDLPWL